MTTWIVAGVVVAAMVYVGRWGRAAFRRPGRRLGEALRSSPEEAATPNQK